MAIDLEKLKWALNLVQEVVDVVDENGDPTGETIVVNNKEEPTAQFKDSGLKYEESLPRAYLNYQFDEIYKAIEDLDSRLTALEP